MAADRDEPVSSDELIRRAREAQESGSSSLPIGEAAGESSQGFESTKPTAHSDAESHDPEAVVAGTAPDDIVVVDEPATPPQIESLEQEAKKERSRVRRRRLIRMAWSVVSAVLILVVLLATGVPVGLAVIPVVVWALVGALFSQLSISRTTTRRETTTQTSTTGNGLTVHTEIQLTNIAFSDTEPTWKGWSKDVGVLSISPERIVIVGPKRQLAIDAPFTAELHDHKFISWMMVKVTGSVGSDQPATIYLVVRGAPLRKDAANPDDVAEESKLLAAEINSVNLT